MFKRPSYLIIFSLSVSVGILTLQTTTAWGFDMFSFFSKNKTMVTVVHASVGAELTKISNYAASSAPAGGDKPKVMKVKVQGESPLTLRKSDRYIETVQSAFVCDLTAPIAMVNDPQNARFDVWELDSIEALKPLTKVPTNPLSSNAKNWISYSVVDVACLSEKQFLIAVNYYDPRSQIALYLYDVSTRTFSLFAQAETHAQQLDNYFKQIDISSSETLILYYSDTKRKSSEIYHNYFNHIVLFSDKHPLGIEILKLSIDDGNIKEWQVNDKNLLLHTVDNREPKQPKQFFWSLDLSKLMTN